MVAKTFGPWPRDSRARTGKNGVRQGVDAMKQYRRIAMVLTASLTVAACSDPEYNPLIGSNRVNSAGPGQMLSGANENFSASRLAIMIEEAIEPKPISNPANYPPTEPEDGPVAIARLDRALANFAKAAYQPATPDRAMEQNRLRDARNTIQDQLVLASNNRCNAYKTYLTRIASHTQFGLGGVATALAGAGAIVTGSASQALSGASAIFSGVNAEFQKDFMGGLMTSVIIPGIDRQRSGLRNDIVDKSCAGVSDYPLTLAIAEVIRYHGACSANVGIAASGQAIARTTPDSISAVLAAAQQARQVSAALSTPTAAEIVRAKQQAAGDAATLDNARAALVAAKARLDGLPVGATDQARQAAVDAMAKAQERVSRVTVQAARSQAVVAALQGITPVNVSAAGPGVVNTNPARSEDPLLGGVLPRPNCAPLDVNGKS
jgi:hypothetical protein